jgi:hypothetical protein
VFTVGLVPNRNSHYSVPFEFLKSDELRGGLMGESVANAKRKSIQSEHHGKRGGWVLETGMVGCLGIIGERDAASKRTDPT